MSVGEWLNDVIQPEDDDYAVRDRDAGDDDVERDDDRYSTRDRTRESDDAPHRQNRHHGRHRRDEDRDEGYTRSRYSGRHRDVEREIEPDLLRAPPRLREAARAAARARDEERRANRAHQDTRAREAERARQQGRHDSRVRQAAREEVRQALREEARDTARAEEARQSARARTEIGEVHARLDKLSHQLERMARQDSARQDLARPEPPRLTGAPLSPHREPAMPAGRPQSRPAPGAGAVGSLTVDDAIAEIAERQRALYGEAPVRPAAPPRATAPLAAPLPEPAPESQSFSAKAPQPLPMAASPPSAPAASPAPMLDISKLEEQLRNITARIETLRPANDFEEVIAGFRKELAEIARQITEALPRHAVESLQIEIQALAQRIDHSRATGSVDSTALAGLERGLAEVRDALHSLKPAESLVGFEDAVRTLAQKVDLIIGKEDPATLQQLETAISALRGIVSHVASDGTLTKVAEDVRALAAKIDDFANQAASGQAVAALESRLDTLANALNASTEAGHAVPRELEKLLSGLIEKLEWVQLTHTDHAALGHLEDRIAQLIKRLDASDARLGNLEAVERGLADLLVHINEARAQSGAAILAAPAPVADIKREVADIKRSDRRVQDSLEAVHGAVEHVVDRLAMIESGLHDAERPAPVPARTETPKAEAARSATSAGPVDREPDLLRSAPAASAAIAPAPASAPEMPRQPPAAESASFEAAPRRMAAASRAPIDPNLPPDHPLEPGSAPGSTLATQPASPLGARSTPSAADRIAASEAAANMVPPPADVAGEKHDYLAAARKAAQAAAAAPPDRKWSAKKSSSPAKSLSQRLRKLFVAGGAVVVAALLVHVVLHMFQDNSSGSAISPPPLPEHSFDAGPEKDSAVTPPPAMPVPGPATDAPANAMPNAAPGQPLSITPTPQPDQNPSSAPQRQSALSNDFTGSLPSRLPPQAQPSAPFQAAPIPVPVPPAAVDADKLPATIGGPTLRAAAAAGDSAAEYEVASRFAEGRGVTVSNEQAVHWLQRAADQGLAPAQFRLGGLYEKGVGVKKDLTKARDFYAAAADRGNGKAMHNLAVLYAEGINGPADYKTAAQWFRKAADRGITDSQYNLAILYARGIGVEQNYAESYKWFTLAATHGDGDAGKKRDEIASHLDTQSIAAAQAAAQKWTAVAQPDEAINVKIPPGGWDMQAAKPAPKPKLPGKPEAKL
jgi:localization factor PodJL